jgi:hypothetical protein
MVQPRPCRCGLIIDSLTQPAWVRGAISDLRAPGLASIELVVLARPSSSFGPEPDAGARSWVYGLYRRLDERKFKGDCRPDALEPGDLGHLIAGCPVVSVEVAPASEQLELSDLELAEIRRADLDVLISFSRMDMGAEIRRIPTRGLWAYRTGNGPVFDASREVLTGEHVCEALLVRLGEFAVGDVVLDRAWSATDRLSVRRNLNRVAWRARPLAARVTAQGTRTSAWPEENARRHSPRPPSSLRAGLMLGLAWRFGVGKVESMMHREQWGLAVTVDASREGPRLDGPPSYHVVPPADRFWADPFPIEHAGRSFVFVEELLFDRPKGHISVLELDDQGARGPARKVLEEAHHLSYPSVFRWKGDIFMTPESSEARRIDLYKATDFPYGWEKVAVLMDGVAAADPTILRADERWWMFLNLPVPGAPNCDECHLYSADRLEGPWQPHPMNPIRSDVRRARPAGRLFSTGGKLYRPAQDCSVRYGWATVINEVERMTTSEYREREVARIEPTWRDDIVATHTLNHAGALTVMDCLFRRSKR